MTVIPAASVREALAVAAARRADGKTGGGGGFGLRARPVGAYVIRGDEFY